MNSQNSVDNEVIEEKTLATKKTSQKKAASKKSEKKLPDALFCNLDNDRIIDINKEFKWNCQKLTENQKRFIFYYCYQFFNKTAYNATDAARKAGYKDSKALMQQAFNLLKNPDIYDEIKNIQSQIDEKLIKVDLKNEIQNILKRKIERTNIDVASYYDIEIAQTEDGISFVKSNIKIPSELTEEQKRNILDVEFVGQRGIPHYKLPNKEQAENEIVKIYKELFDKQEDNSDGMEIETTAEIIKGSLQVKTKVIKSNSDIAELSDLRTENTAERAEED